MRPFSMISFGGMPKKGDRCAHPPLDGRLCFICPKPRVEDRRNVDENSVFRFRNERKELPLLENQIFLSKIDDAWLEIMGRLYSG